VIEEIGQARERLPGATPVLTIALRKICETTLIRLLASGCLEGSLKIKIPAALLYALGPGQKQPAMVPIGPFDVLPKRLALRQIQSYPNSSRAMAHIWIARSSK